MVYRMERRWERRLLCADLVRIEWTDRLSETWGTTAILEDISRNGACLQTDIPLPVEAPVRIRRGRKSLEGTVSYCVYHHDIGYFAGITFAAKRGWSRRVFLPKHLIDPATLELARKSSGAGGN
jgi:hypothetical protein